MFSTVLYKNSKKIISCIKKNKKYVILAVVLVAFLIVRIYFSINFYAGLYGLLKLAELCFIFFYSAAFIKNKSNLKYLAVVSSISVIFEVSLSLLQVRNQGSINGIFYFFGERFFTSDTPGVANASIYGTLFLRPYATFSHPNVLAGFLLLSQLLLIGILPYLKTKTKKLTMLAIFFCLFGIMLSLSRVVVGLELFVFGFFVIIGLEKEKKGNKKLVYLIPALLLFAFIYMTLPRLLNTSTKEDSYAQRQNLINVSFNIIKKSPLVGVGINNFLYQLANEKKAKNTPFQPVHNIPLLLVSELGIPLGFVLIVLYIQLFKKVFRGKELKLFPKYIYVLFLISLTVLSLTDHYFRTIQQGQILFVFIIGLIYGSSRSKPGSRK